MQTVTFGAKYRHPKTELTAVHYRAGETYTVANDVADAARKAGKLKETRRARSHDRTTPGGADAAEG